jgi:hypothetical protein
MAIQFGPNNKTTQQPVSNRSNQRSSPMRFIDFAVRAWLEGKYLQVIAHSTPAGGMRQPVSIKLGEFKADDYRIRGEASLAEGAKVGRDLSRLLLTDAVWNLLGESLRIVAPNPDLGLRVRLCLDEDLIDLPWEFLYRRDVDAKSARSGFLLMDGRISLVREPPSLVSTRQVTDRTQRGLFVGTFFDDGSDVWAVEVEYKSLTKALRPVKALISLDFLRADSSSKIEQMLAMGCDVFHYAGHTELESGIGKLVELARSSEPFYVNALPERAPWASSDVLATRLLRAGTRLAVFNACNSGFWGFMRPFMRAGIPTVIGVQGSVSNLAALNFAESLYKSLAVGLSLDEALTYARLYVVNPGRSYYECDWGRFMAYMPTDTAVLFPRTTRKAIQQHQYQVRAERESAVRDVAALVQEMDGEGVSHMLSEVAQRSVLILGRFTDERKVVLDAIKKALATPPRQYVPVLFDFEKPGDRDLIESVVRFASTSRFVVADLSDPKSIPAELQAIVPTFPSLPVVPIIEASQREYPVADNILRRDSVLKPIVKYRNQDHLIKILDEQVLAPAEALYAKLHPSTGVLSA